MYSFKSTVFVLIDRTFISVFIKALKRGIEDTFTDNAIEFYFYSSKKVHA
jgi:hypothetical protein